MKKGPDNPNEDEKQRKKNRIGVPSLETGKNVSPTASGPEFRSAKNASSRSTLASTSSFARSVSSMSSWPYATLMKPENLSLDGEKFEFQRPPDVRKVAAYDTPQPFQRNYQVAAKSLLRDSLLPDRARTSPFSLPTSLEYDPICIKTAWTNPQLRPVPKHYPMERSSRILELREHSLAQITSNLSAVFRVLGIQVKYFEAPAGAALLTPEQVEAFLYLWSTGGGKQIYVEVQRRRGDSLCFYRYARHILEAASGDFEASEIRDYSDSRYLKAAEKLLRAEMERDAKERDESLMSIELVSGLLTKDRFDARLLGMESLCILTDPRKTNLNTALLVSHAVVFGSYKDEKEHTTTFETIQKFVLNVVQNRCMDDEALLLKDMIVEYDSDDECYFDDDRDQAKPPEYTDSMKSLTHYGLTLLANAWEVLSTFESFESEPEPTQIGVSMDDAVSQFEKITSEFGRADILVTLLTDLQRAEVKTHNACLAAKCLRILCQSSEDFRQRMKAQNGVVQTRRAEEIGKQTNARLERESSHLLLVLQE